MDGFVISIDLSKPPKNQDDKCAIWSRHPTYDGTNRPSRRANGLSGSPSIFVVQCFLFFALSPTHAVEIDILCAPAGTHGEPDELETTEGPEDTYADEDDD